MLIEYRTTVQPLWRNATSDHFRTPDGIYHAPTMPLEPPPCASAKASEWNLHSVQPWGFGYGEPKLLVVWMREVG